MNDYIYNFIKDISLIIDFLKDTKVIQKNFNKSLISVDYLSKSKQGDISSNILIILKQNLLNKNYNINKNILKKIEDIKYVKKIIIHKAGFLNIFFNEKFLSKQLFQILKNPLNYGYNNFGKGKKINVEFVSANPTGPIHIAHLRGAVFGDVLANILEKTGYKVTREYYINDAGTQITILANSLYKRYLQLQGKKINFSNNEYPGDYLIKIAKNIFSKDKDKWIIEKENIKNKYFKSYAVKNILNTIINDLKKINISFDKFSYETKILKKNKIHKILNILKKKNLLYEGILEKPKGENLADWKPRKQLLFKSSNFDDDSDRALQKVDGEWTYFSNDTAYHYDKISRNYFQLINVWGADHIGYIKRIKSIIYAITDNKNILDIKICQIVRLLKNGKVLKMSKREGVYITLKEIFDLVGKDPLRYFMISTKNETPIDFDVEKVIERNKDNQVFYCQYAYARASSVINKALKIDQFKAFKKQINKFDISTITNYEREIILRLISWPYLLRQSSNLKQPTKIINFIEDISSLFHSFWNKGKEDHSLRFIDISNSEKTISKLIWIEAMRIVLKNAFQIIGIEAHEKM